MAVACAGPIPTEIGQLTHLTELALFDNHFTGRCFFGGRQARPHHGKDEPQCVCLGASPCFVCENGHAGRIPTEIFKLKWLTELKLEANMLTGASVGGAAL